MSENTEKYLAFVDNGYYTGFMSTSSSLASDPLWEAEVGVGTTVEFTGPKYPSDITQQQGLIDEEFEHLMKLAKLAVLEAGYKVSAWDLEMSNIQVKRTASYYFWKFVHNALIHPLMSGPWEEPDWLNRWHDWTADRCPGSG